VAVGEPFIARVLLGVEGGSSWCANEFFASWRFNELVDSACWSRLLSFGLCGRAPSCRVDAAAAPTPGPTAAPAPTVAALLHEGCSSASACDRIGAEVSGRER
jgi:hypothetical protein